MQCPSERGLAGAELNVRRCEEAGGRDEHRPSFQARRVAFERAGGSADGARSDREHASAFSGAVVLEHRSVRRHGTCTQMHCASRVVSGAAADGDAVAQHDAALLSR
eukprot:1093958-Rhodomonas_salina.1